MTPEGKIKNMVTRMLKGYPGLYYLMPVQNGMGAATLDYVGSHHGHAFGIETKAPGKRPTARQELTIAAMRKAGMAVFVVDGDLSDLKQWLDANDTRKPEASGGGGSSPT